MLLRILLILIIVALLNAYVAADIICRWPWAQGHLPIIWGLALAFFLLQITAPFGKRFFFSRFKKHVGRKRLSVAIDWLSYMAFGALSCLFIYSIMIDILSILWLVTFPPHNLDLFNERMLMALAAVTLLSLGIGYWQAIAGPVVRKVDIPLAHLPAEFDGFRIVQISDLHVDAMTRRPYVEKVVRLAQSLKPDLLALTGDFADGSVAELRPEIAPLADLTAPAGKFFITGNHEYYWNESAWVEEHRRLGAQILKNEHVVIRRGAAEIILAGVTDYSTHSLASDQASSPKKALEGAPKDRVKILLAHQPVSYRAAQAAGFDLQISGHTHGGQYFPFSLLIRFFQRYYKGLNRYKGMWIYVSCGTGYWGPPLRTFVPPEITLITLHPAKA